jgi:hypothetical protein
VLFLTVGQLSFSIISSSNKSSSSFIYLNCGDLLLNGLVPFTKAVSISVQHIPFSNGYLLVVPQQTTYEIFHSNSKFRFMIPDYTVTSLCLRRHFLQWHC